MLVRREGREAHRASRKRPREKQDVSSHSGKEERPENNDSGARLCVS